jgi:hypothetical protein
MEGLRVKDSVSVKQEFKAPCWKAYRLALGSLKFLAKFHNIDFVIDELRRDL